MALTSFGIVILIFLGATNPTSAFLPRQLLAWVVRGLDLSLESVLTHKEITRNAILQAAVDVLRSNPNPTNPESSDRIAAITTLNENSLITAYYGQRQTSRRTDFESVIEAISVANSEVDLLKSSRINAAAHFDSEQFEAAQARLIQKRRTIVSQISASNFELARLETGRFLHTLQDFYSHSNWIENGNRGPYQSLGKVNEILQNTASTTRTCNDCNRADYSFTLALVNFITKVVQPYVCRNNVVDILRSGNSLTTGYHSGQVGMDGQVIEKPEGKCSHGGFLDTSSELSATGGINKDSPFEVWSPHYYLYDEAVSVTQQATIDFLAEIRDEVNDDILFSTFLGVPLVDVETISVAYVIDTTGSMMEELPEIQATLPTIRNNLVSYVNSFGGGVQVRYILVPFNDPDPGFLFESNDIDEFLGMIAALVADGGGDTPEPSIGATIRAIEASEPGSPIYVFTDAPASDVYRINEATSLLTVKRTPIYFSLVDLNVRRKRSLQKQDHQVKTRTKRQTDTNSYQELATFSGGQVLHVRTNDISNLGNLVSFSVLQNRRTILSASGTSFGTVSHVFPIDSFILVATISISGTDVTVSVLTPQGISATSHQEYTVSLNTAASYVSQLNVTSNALRGNWTITIQSRGSYSIQVQGISEVTIAREYYQVDSSSVYGFSSFTGKPLQGEPLLIVVTIGNNNFTSITVNSFNIIDNNGESLMSLTNLTSLDGGSYAAAFIPPSESFSLQLAGSDLRGYGFSHFFDTSLEVSSIFLIPRDEDISVVNILPGAMKTINLLLVNRGENTQFQLSASTSNISGLISYDILPNITTITQNSSVEIQMVLNADESVSEDLAVTFTVLAQAVNNSGINNFIDIDVLTTTDVYIPPTKLPEAPDTTTSSTAVPNFMMKTMCIMVLVLFVCFFFFV